MMEKFRSIIFLFLFLTLVQSGFYLIDVEDDGEGNNQSGLTGNVDLAKVWICPDFGILQPCNHWCIIS